MTNSVYLTQTLIKIKMKGQLDEQIHVLVNKKKKTTIFLLGQYGDNAFTAGKPVLGINHLELVWGGLVGP